MTATESGLFPAPPPEPSAARAPVQLARDGYVDFLRAFSILVVVLWHWAFTILQWTPRAVRDQPARLLLRAVGAHLAVPGTA
ncbi:MAG TPA: hypothetical protein VNP03_14225, partial [Pseudonocardia sp.]|nr:hypothetical protein [Pseudonocardia sp.]